MTRSLFLVILLLDLLLTLAMKSPADYFVGTNPRPKLEIISPENGQVLEDALVEIKIAIDGYKMPSNFHDSSICVALSAIDSVIEKCFEQTYDLTYHVNGLTAGKDYGIRIALLERANVIAVSVRNFRVAGISGDMFQNNEVVTIQTAVQVAIRYQTIGMEKEAESIYRSILHENPLHPDALHLLGLIFYQKGDAVGAISYIEQAILAGNKTKEDFHNSLGECYRLLGRFEEAREQFQLALKLNNEYYSAMYNLGLTYQKQRETWDIAITYFQHIVTASQVNDSSVLETIGSESKIRECDLLQAQYRFNSSLLCWEEGQRMFPQNNIIHNELGNLYTQFGNYEAALQCYITASQLGSSIAVVNAAHILELQGYLYESKLMFENAIQMAVELSLPQYHLRVRLATITPRIMPSLSQELLDIRKNIEKELDVLLNYPSENIIVDNSPPLHYGFTLGFYYLYHGYNNFNIKSKLYHVYSRLCPALLQGYFMDNTNTGTYTNNEIDVAAERYLDISPISDDHDPPTVTKHLKVGFLSRYFTHNHIVGVLCNSFLPILQRDLQDKVHVYVYHISDSSVDALVAEEPMLLELVSGVYKYTTVPIHIGAASQLISEEKLDILVFPEVGFDPMTYFMAYSRLAPVQCVWYGHPDTTGLPTIDYFLTATTEKEYDNDAYYSEKLHYFSHLGTIFKDYYYREIIDMMNSTHYDALTLTHRERLIETLKLPKAAHLYIINNPLYVIHGDFDQIISRILITDRLGYVIVIDVNDRPTWQNIFTARLAGKFSQEIKARILYVSPSGLQDDTLGLIMAAHVVLDTFPVSTLSASLQVLGVGVPVITMPSHRLAGRFTHALYGMMGYTNMTSIADSDNINLIVNNVNEYIANAMAIAHRPMLRSRLSAYLLSKRHLLFGNTLMTQEWKYFFHKVTNYNMYI